MAVSAPRNIVWSKKLVENENLFAEYIYVGKVEVAARQTKYINFQKAHGQYIFIDVTYRQNRRSLACSENLNL